MGDNNFRNQAQAQAKAGSEAAQAGVDALNAVNPMDPVNAGSAGVGILAKLLAKFGLKKLSGLRKADEASSDPTLVFDEKKFEYIFGRVASNPHNKARSRQLALQMKALGVFDDEAGRSLLEGHFNIILGQTDNIVDTFQKRGMNFEVRESYFVGPSNKAAKFKTTFEVMNDGSRRFNTVIIEGNLF